MSQEAGGSNQQKEKVCFGGGNSTFKDGTSERRERT